MSVTVASLSAGLAGPLLTSAIQRVGSLTFQKAMRVSRIEQTLKGSAQRNSNVKLAMEDFETVIGNRYGQYTEKLAQFLEELERSGLITAMVEDALLERRSQEVKAAFVALHARARGRIITRQDGGEAEWRIDPNILQTITYGDLKLSFSRVVILGDPGGGKSTICQNLCFDLAKQAAIALATDNKPTAQLQKFPIRIVLRTFEKARTAEPQLSLFEFIIRDLRNYVSLEKSQLEHAALYLLTSRAAVLAL